jgi:hypothetical protein
VPASEPVATSAATLAAELVRRILAAPTGRPTAPAAGPAPSARTRRSATRPGAVLAGGRDTGPGAGRAVVAIDGWSGSGKTHLAARLAPALEAACVHLDDLVPGWHGLAESVTLLVDHIIEPWVRGEAVRWPGWDWDRDRPGPPVELPESSPPASVLVVEGCGAGAAAVRPWLSALLWVDADAEVRAERLRARRDWPIYERWLHVWTAQEETLRAADDPRPWADATVRIVPSDPLGVPDRRPSRPVPSAAPAADSAPGGDLLVSWRAPGLR